MKKEQAFLMWTLNIDCVGIPAVEEQVQLYS